MLMSTLIEAGISSIDVYHFSCDEEIYTVDLLTNIEVILYDKLANHT
jgi:hypothetical protein